jgi:hypothetical protein
MAGAPDELLAVRSAAKHDPELIQALAETLKPFRAARPADGSEVGETDEALNAAAARGDWSALIAAAATALPARLGARGD